MKTVCCITTLGHNVGDDFVREGILHLLDRASGPWQVTCVHKHLPLTARPVGALVRACGFDRFMGRIHRELPLRLCGKIDEMLPLMAGSDRILTCDVLVQSGAPVYWTHPGNECQNNEWWKPLLERRWVPVAAGRPLLNLAAGTAQRWNSDGSEFTDCPSTLDYVRRFFDLAALTTVRDDLSTRVLALAGRSAERLPCTSLFAIDRVGIVPQDGEYVVLNYLRPSLASTFGQLVDADAWERRFVAFASRLAAITPCMLVCHDRHEYTLARRLLPEVKRFLSPHHADYLRVYAGASWGIVNRVHAGFALASLGKPVAIVGVDSRAQMASAIGADAVFVDDANERWLAATASRLAGEVNSYPAIIARLKQQTEARYVDLLRGVLGTGDRA
jgi:hypothetical protein